MYYRACTSVWVGSGFVWYNNYVLVLTMYLYYIIHCTLMLNKIHTYTLMIYTSVMFITRLCTWPSSICVVSEANIYPISHAGKGCVETRLISLNWLWLIIIHICVNILYCFSSILFSAWYCLTGCERLQSCGHQCLPGWL